MVGLHHQHDGHGFGCTLGVGDGQGGLVSCVSWGHKESDMTEWLNWTELNVCKSFSTTLDKGLRKNLKKKTIRNGEIGESKLNEMEYTIENRKSETN